MMDPNENDQKASETLIQEDHLSEEEVEFVGEGPSRPVLDCIDLVSDDESQTLYHYGKSKDHVTATLDRLARDIEVQKRKRAAKTKAFQDKLNLQRAHGLQALALNKDRPGASAAKICVNQWLQMPGLKSGYVSSNRRTFVQPKDVVPINTEPITCPVMRCNRNFDNRPLLFGHLKRFDHSPCDPTIFLHGVCDTSYVCLVCQHRFATTREYTAHLAAKVKLADGHSQTLSPLDVQCFACPSCFLLFNKRDDCLKHMSASNHFVRGIKLNGEKGIPSPVPIPSYAKKVLIALCKDIPFQVVCTSCNCELRSHMEVTAHFRTLCRNAGPASLSDKSIADVASIFRLYAFCQTCKQGLSDEAHIAKHIARTSHNVKQITSIEESILAFCYLNEGTKTPSDFCLLAANARLKHCTLKRSLNDTDDSSVLSKRVKESETGDGLKKESSLMATAWFCECSHQFAAEEDAEKHIMTANKIFHKCMVCSKLAVDPAIIRLHMSRFHGGARLESFLFWCQMCKTELARIENVLMHIVDCHGGHSFYYEQEVPEEQSTSSEAEMILELPERDTSPSPQQSAECLWQCQICEEMFDSEETVIQHCKSLSMHQFHKFCCDVCKKKFHKMETLLRHCQLQHDAVVKMKYFCGLCEDLYFDEEAAFFGHYESFHSLDYTCIPNQGQSSNKMSDLPLNICSEHEKQLTCGCLAKYSLKVKQKTDTKLCLDRLFGKGKLWYSCSSCSATDQTFEGINTHLCKNKEQASSRNVVVKCSICSKSFAHPEAAQSHYHVKHSFLNEPRKSYNFRTDGSKGEVFTFTARNTSVNKVPARPKHTSAKSSRCEAQNSAPNHIVETNASWSGKIKPETDAMEIENTDKGSLELQDCELPDLDFLKTMTHIVFIDLDNWAQFFSHLPGYLNQGTFVWGFQGGKSGWKPPMDCKYFKNLSTTGCFFLHPHCSDRKDAADFAICLHAGRLDERLPKQIPFTVLSGDKGFMELENQFKKTQRPAHVINPHQVGGDVMCALLNSISETTQETLDEDMEINSMGQDEDADMKEAIRRSLLET
ncbi:PREDICTED: E3 SUMO-protein ligase ZNF451 [Nanorana parkeri]|uniref:E3 SUMO-protein ligase ZNF451 n=1 Tax=Nanorana parkeri TaxID=125878 RepID=UPI000854D33D|nr:PREDICTED: E3 SUMO-protein ligase ZNF451 [Nanorana parkeri]